MIEISQGIGVKDLLQSIFVQIKTQIMNPGLPKSKFTLDNNMHLDINLHNMVLTQVSPYTDLRSCIANAKAVINPKTDDEMSLLCTVFAKLHHENAKDLQLISKLETYIN